jgi:hypothetical protein
MEGVKVNIFTSLTFKSITFLLICAALMITSINSASALSSADQSQTGEVIVNDGKISYNVDQQQSAEILSGDGIITQAQQGSEEVFVNPQSGVEITTVRASEIQSVDVPSTDDSNNKNSIVEPNSNLVKTINTDDSGEIKLSQSQASDGDIYQEQRAFLKIISTPKDRVIGIMHMQQK